MTETATPVRARAGAAAAGPRPRLHDLFEAAIEGDARDDRIAVESTDGALTFADLRRSADDTAHRLARDVRPGDRVALLFDRTPRAWVAMLALSKLGAAWVPLDPSFPPERMAFIAADCGATVALTTDALAHRLDGTGLAARTIGAPPPRPTRVPRFRSTASPDDLAYVIYTSGTTGTPKGVPITHAALANFIRVAADCYGYRPTDRVYQGLTIAFDFAVEEIWVPLVVGARLVPAPDGTPLVGVELAAFLAANRITALCCVPTMLASIDAELPALRLLMVSGESCPAALVDRFARPGRRMLNLYGPTETTVSATFCELVPGQPVTIGRPLPTYRTAIVDPATGVQVAAGVSGELVIAGPGVARGYLGRPELTARAFLPDPDGAAGALRYRTGDLVRLDADGRIVYLGRIDSQVKVRGYRIELDEIESVMLAVPGVVQAAVSVVDQPSGQRALAGYFTDDAGASVDPTALLAELQLRLPAYMVPATLDRLQVLPMLPSQKVDRRALPTPGRPVRTAVHAAADAHEAAVAACIAAVLGEEEIDVTADLFTDLGADSFSIARCCAALRDGPMPGVTTRLVYANPSVRALAAAAPAVRRADAGAPAVHRASRLAHTATGLAQSAVLAGAVLAAAGGIEVVDRLLGGATGLRGYLLAVAVTAVVATLLLALPVALKWTLVGRWTERRIPAWSAGYLRFWVVRLALHTTPARLLAGSPLYTLFLRALGARIDRGALVLTNHIPVCTDLVEIGQDAVVGPGVKLDGYRVEDGFVRTGRVVLGRRAAVGYGSHLDIGTAIEADGRLAHASALLSGQRVPAGRAWHGSPALDCGAAPDAEPVPRVGAARRAVYSLLQFASLVLVAGPLTLGVAVAAVDVDVFDPLQAAWFALGLLVAAWLVRACVPRLLARLLEPGRDYPLYGRRWAGLRAAIGIANSPLLNELFGDSSAIVFYLRSVGVRFRQVLQTGSNFGTAQHFDVPSWCSIGGGTLISDGLAMPNAEFTPHSFRVRRIRVGDRVFMGNGVVYPPGAGVGDDVLLATKVMVPVDGLRRTGVGLLGSPAFEVPRSVRRDEQVRAEDDPAQLRRGLAAKNRHNTATGALFLLHRFAVGYLAVAAVGFADGSSVPGLALAIAAAAVGELLLLVLTDLACRGLRRLRPLTCSLYDPRFWRHERYWKLSDPKALAVLDGTPLKPIAWRLLGVRVGRMLLDDGASMPERSMVVLGDHVTLGARSTLHGHSLEDGVFKSGPIRIGDGVTIGPSALVHYGVEVGDAARVAPDAFLMKGEVVRRGEAWAGNPAHPAPPAA